VSLLPGEMLSPNDPLGRVNDDGTVTIDKNYWLLLYNLVQNTLGTGSGLPADALIDLEMTDVDAAGADTAALRQPIANLALLGIEPSDPPVQPPYFLLEPLLPDPVPQAQPVTVVSVGGSPFTYTASFTGLAVITGGTVSLISLVRQGTTVATGLTTGLFPLSRLDQLVITHTGAPTMTFLPT